MEAAQTRTAAVKELFSTDVDKTVGETTYYRCLIDGCKSRLVGCKGGGAPGRNSHLKTHHPEEFAKLPAKRTYTVPQKRERDVVGVANGNAAPADAPATQGHDPQPKVHKDVCCHNIRATVELFARKFLPASYVEDPFFKSSNLTRKSLPIQTKMVAEELMATFVSSIGSDFISICADSGTNADERTLNLTVVHRCVARTIAAMRVPTQDAVGIENAVTSVIERLQKINPSLRVASFVTDNAANMRKATSQLAKRHKTLNGYCACHGINQMVRHCLYDMVVVNAAREHCNVVRCAELQGVHVPQEIDTRWVCAFAAMDEVVTEKNYHIINSKKILSEAALEEVVEAHRLLAPFFYATKKCEKDSASIFDVATEFSECFATAADLPDFHATFERNCYCPSLVLACFASPFLSADGLAPPIKAMVSGMFKNAVADLDPDCEGRPVLRELEYIFTGTLQRQHRIVSDAERPSIEAFWAGGRTPYMQQLVKRLLAFPASSASVERSFSAHSRCHTTGRKSLGEETVEQQLVLHSLLLTANSTGFRPSAAGVTQQTADRIFEWCWAVWQAPLADQLREGDLVNVWYRTVPVAMDPRSAIPREVAYKCKLEKREGALWKVRWFSDVSSKERFNPALDCWLKSE